MNVDSYYEIGAGHTFCQDYCLNGQVGEISYVIGSDGCSGSKDTDVGARVLCHLAKKRILQTISELLPLTNLSVMTLQVHLLDMLSLFKQTLSLPSTAFDATLFIAIEYQGKCLVLGWGDGIIIEKRKSGLRKVWKIEYTSGAPFYLSYFLNPERRATYEEQFKEERVKYYVQEDRFDSVPSISGSWTEEYQNDIIFLKVYESKDFDSITICSDGLDTYQHEEDIDLDTVLRYTDYKNFVGDFVKRRMKKIKKENKQTNSFHFDDIFCATMKF